MLILLSSSHSRWIILMRKMNINLLQKTANRKKQKTRTCPKQTQTVVRQNLVKAFEYCSRFRLAPFKMTIVQITASNEYVIQQLFVDS